MRATSNLEEVPTEIRDRAVRALVSGSVHLDLLRENFVPNLAKQSRLFYSGAAQEAGFSRV